MPFVHNLTARPPERYDAVPWTEARIQESADNVSFATVETINLAPLDADPTEPQLRNLTTNDATLEEGWFRVTWADALSNTSPPSPSVFSPSLVDDGYPALGALVGASTVEALTGLTSAEQVPLRAMAIAAVEEFCGQPFNETAETRKLNGNGRRELGLPWRLAELTTLTVSGSSLDGSDVELSHGHDSIYIGADAIPGNWASRALRMDDRPPHFTAGIMTVAIEGIWGWSDTELDHDDPSNDIAVAIRKDMEDQALALLNPMTDTSKVMVKMEAGFMTQGPLVMNPDRTMIPLSPEVQVLLGPYVWNQPAFVT